jgi:EmrB/QacA subfamily drug resistance transporter
MPASLVHLAPWKKAIANSKITHTEVIMYRRQIDARISTSVVFVAALFMSIMDGTIVNVALPALQRQLVPPGMSADMVVVAYLISLAIVIPASGWLGDRWGTRRIFLLSLVLFTLASALCGLAWNFPVLLLCRLLQGAAGGALTPVGSAMLYRAFPPDERVHIGRILMVPTVIAPALGPILGGILVEQLSWRWIFFINVPVGAVASLFGLIFMREHREEGAGRFDLWGFVLVSVGLALAMYALSESPARGWASPDILVSALAGLLLLGAFVILELRLREPLLDLRLFGNRLFRTTNLASFFSGAAFTGILFVGPLFLQEGLGKSALVSGLTTFPDALGVIVSTQVVAMLYPHVGPRRLMALGLAGMAMVIALLAFMQSGTNLWIMRLLLFLVGAGMACSFLPVNAASLATIASADLGRASTLSNVQGRLGNALGVALLSEVLTLVSALHPVASPAAYPDLLPYRLAFLVAAALALGAACLSLAVSDRDAAITMRRRKVSAQEQARVSRPLELD